MVSPLFVWRAVFVGSRYIFDVLKSIVYLRGKDLVNGFSVLD